MNEPYWSLSDVLTLITIFAAVVVIPITFVVMTWRSRDE